jgi:hypothetical protein
LEIIIVTNKKSKGHQMKGMAAGALLLVFPVEEEVNPSPFSSCYHNLRLFCNYLVLELANQSECRFLENVKCKK